MFYVGLCICVHSHICVCLYDDRKWGPWIMGEAPAPPHLLWQQDDCVLAEDWPSQERPPTGWPRKPLSQPRVSYFFASEVSCMARRKQWPLSLSVWRNSAALALEDSSVSMGWDPLGHSPLLLPPPVGERCPACRWPTGSAKTLGKSFHLSEPQFSYEVENLTRLLRMT